MFMKKLDAKRLFLELSPPCKFAVCLNANLRVVRTVICNVGYIAREILAGKEFMFFAPNLTLPALV